MKHSFDSTEYIVQIGHELVAHFDRANLATTPGLVGNAKETPVREKMESILPNGLAVGTGCIIDSSGSVSRQIDVVIYEKEICPVFRLNNDDSATFFPCEGVVAVGEIKSTLTTNELTDIFLKIASVKHLKRFAKPPTNEELLPNESSPPIPFRPYGSMVSAFGTKEEEFNQLQKPYNQIYGFALAGSLSLQPKTLSERFIDLELCAGPEYSPNLIVTLDNTVLCPLNCFPDRHQFEIMLSTQEANSIYCVTNSDSSFQFLISRIQNVYYRGSSVELFAFDQYFSKDGIEALPFGGMVSKLRKRRRP